MSRRAATCFLATVAVAVGVFGAARGARAEPQPPWMNPSLSPDERARLLEKQMTLDERIRLVHGPMAIPFGGRTVPEGALGGAGYIPGIPRLGIPALQESDASLGVTNPGEVRKGDGGTPLPSGLAIASTFDSELARQGGEMVAREARSQGFNVLLGGGANIARDPRNGRNFEYLGEDPLLAGRLAGAAIKGTQSQRVISTVKHFAVNDQETLRHSLSSKISEAAMRESDLLAFQIAIEEGDPGSVMCAYNRVNGPYACNHDMLLNKVLKGDWGYRGWVMSDWGAVHGVEAALNGLDQQSGEQLDKAVYFGDPLQKAVTSGEIPPARLSDMVRRILRSMFAVGLFEHPAQRQPIDTAKNADVARRVAEAGIVLLRNERRALPLPPDTRRIAVIGGFANRGVLSGGGSSQVVPPEGPGVRIPQSAESELPDFFNSAVYHPSAPLRTLRAALPNATVSFDNGAYPQAAAAHARSVDVAIVFATQWMTEGNDAHDLTLPQGQDELIAAVAAANPRTIVVLETGGPVLMPWLDKVDAVIAAWYPGARGGEALAGILVGTVNPSGHLPITFPASESQLPRPQLPGWGLPRGSEIDVDYDIEGSDVGYRWFARKGLKPLFAFGHGLSYSTFAYDQLTLTGGKTLTASFTVTNTSDRAGQDVPQVYLTSAAGTRMLRLIGFSRVALQPNESRRVSIAVDPRLLARFDERQRKWRSSAGQYEVAVGSSAERLSLTCATQMQSIVLKP